MVVCVLVCVSLCVCVAAVVAGRALYPCLSVIARAREVSPISVDTRRLRYNVPKWVRSVVRWDH